MMNLKWLTLLGLLLLAAQAFGGEQLVLKTQKDKESYTTGVEFVQNLKQQGGAVDLDIVIQGIKDGLTGENLLMTEAEIRKTMAGLEKTRQPNQAANKHDHIQADVADKGIKDDTGVRQREYPSEQRNGEFLSNVTFAKEEAQVKKNGPTDANSQITSMQARMSAAERGQHWSERQLRALEMRRRTMGQERR